MKTILMMLLLTSAARAQPHELTRLLTVGDDAWAHGFYGEALGAYQDAYQLSQEPSLLLKVGSCYEHLGNPHDAAAAYRRYLAAEPSLSSGERADLEAKVSMMESRQRPTAAVIVAAPSPPLAPAPSKHLVGLRRAVVVTAIATAVTALVAGGVTIGAADAYRQLGADCRGRSGGCTDDAAAHVSSLNHSADVMWGLAAAGAITSITLQLVLRHQRK